MLSLMKNKEIQKSPPPFKNQVEYRGDTNQKICESYYSPSDTGGCTRKMDDEHKNEGDG